MEKRERINKFLTEELLKKCWHVTEPSQENGFSGYKCKKCSEFWAVIHPGFHGAPFIDYYNPEGFFKLWEVASTSLWFKQFLKTIYKGYLGDFDGNLTVGDFYAVLRKDGDCNLINYDTFPDLLAEYLGFKE